MSGLLNTGGKKMTHLSSKTLFRLVTDFLEVVSETQKSGHSVPELMVGQVDTSKFLKNNPSLRDH